jgi:signal transduction histidine kinase
MFTSFAELIAQMLHTEDRQHATELALRDAEATSLLRDQFIAVLGHDLRNPLAIASMTAEIMLRKPDDAQMNKLGVRLRAASRRMSGLINDILDFARGRLGAGIGVDRTLIDDLPVALEEVIAELRDAHPGHKVVSRFEVTTPVLCDRARVQQLVSNLLGNALTYGAPDQPVVVAAHVAGDQLEISVSNGGEPIAAQNLERIFEPYWRSTGSEARSGLGLGLYICSEIVRAHGGTIAVRSSTGEGTRFTALLPAVAG